MGWLSALVGGGDTVAKPVEAVGNVLDALFTSDEERLDKKIVLERLAQQPGLAQVELNKVEAGHRSLFVAGWRPFIGWSCGLAMCFNFLIFPLASFVMAQTGYLVELPTLDMEQMMPVLMGMLGLGGLRTVEKIKNVSK